jgi:hypothetical protein
MTMSARYSCTKVHPAALYVNKYLASISLTPSNLFPLGWRHFLTETKKIVFFSLETSLLLIPRARPLPSGHSAVNQKSAACRPFLSSVPSLQRQVIVELQNLKRSSKFSGFPRPAFLPESNRSRDLERVLGRCVVQQPRAVFPMASKESRRQGLQDCKYLV